MAVPKFRTSKARTQRRQSLHMKLTLPSRMVCANCGNQTLLHRICSRCGFYRGRQVIAPESKI